LYVAKPKDAFVEQSEKAFLQSSVMRWLTKSLQWNTQLSDFPCNSFRCRDPWPLIKHKLIGQQGLRPALPIYLQVKFVVVLFMFSFCLHSNRTMPDNKSGDKKKGLLKILSWTYRCFGENQ